MTIGNRSLKTGSDPDLPVGPVGRAQLSTLPHGVLLHTGRKAERLAERLWGIPLAAAIAAS
jgi:hypothetical protein